MELVSLFSAAFLAATILPAQSEALLAALVLAGAHTPALLIMVATAGNVLGACVNWLLGRYLLHFQDRKWFPVKEAALARATRIYQRYGLWTLLFSWVPFIGDPLTLVAGMLRVRFLPFVILVTLGKLARYIAVAAII